VRLQPIETSRWDRSNIQAIDVRAVGQIVDPVRIVGDRCANQSLPHRFDHLFLAALHDRYKREHVLLHRNTLLSVCCVDYHRTQVRASFFFDHPLAIRCCHVRHTGLCEILLNHGPGPLCHLHIGERR